MKATTTANNVFFSFGVVVAQKRLLSLNRRLSTATTVACFWYARVSWFVGQLYRPTKVDRRSWPTFIGRLTWALGKCCCCLFGSFTRLCGHPTGSGRITPYPIYDHIPLITVPKLNKLPDHLLEKSSVTFNGDEEVGQSIRLSHWSNITSGSSNTMYSRIWSARHHLLIFTPTKLNSVIITQYSLL